MIFKGSRQIDTSIKEFERMRSVLRRAEHTFGEEGGSNVMPTNQTMEAAVSPSTTPATGLQVAPIKSPAAAADLAASVVSIGSSWQGTLKVDGSVRIDGKLAGEVEAGEMVFVAETAEVDAELRAATVVVAGRFKGKVQCRERLEIMPTGRVNADLTTKSLVVHDGAFVEGQVHMAEADIAPAKDASKDASKDRVIDRAMEVLRTASSSTNPASPIKAQAAG